MDCGVVFDARVKKMFQDFAGQRCWQALMDADRSVTPLSQFTAIAQGDPRLLATDVHPIVANHSQFARPDQTDARE